MALRTDNTIQYLDLIKQVKTYIKENCVNIGSYKNGMSACFKPPFTKDIKATMTGKATQTAGYKYSYTTARSTELGLGIVTETQIEEDINNFLASRGIASKAETPVTTKGILNFYNNIASFMSAKLILVTSELAPGEQHIFYKTTGVTYPAVSNLTNENDIVTPTEITESLNALTSTINITSKSVPVKYDISCYSSSSSSSSPSSSSSSSSSSSCSSVFIAYFNI